jgi:hypothetical protein
MNENLYKLLIIQIIQFRFTKLTGIRTTSVDLMLGQ